MTINRIIEEGSNYILNHSQDNDLKATVNNEQELYQNNKMNLDARVTYCRHALNGLKLFKKDLKAKTQKERALESKNSPDLVSQRKDLKLKIQNLTSHIMKLEKTLLQEEVEPLPSGGKASPADSTKSPTFLKAAKQHVDKKIKESGGVFQAVIKEGVKQTVPGFRAVDSLHELNSEYEENKRNINNNIAFFQNRLSILKEIQKSGHTIGKKGKAFPLTDQQKTELSEEIARLDKGIKKAEAKIKKLKGDGVIDVARVVVDQAGLGPLELSGVLVSTGTTLAKKLNQMHHIKTSKGSGSLEVVKEVAVEAIKNVRDEVKEEINEEVKKGVANAAVEASKSGAKAGVEALKKSSEELLKDQCSIS